MHTTQGKYPFLRKRKRTIDPILNPEEELILLDTKRGEIRGIDVKYELWGDGYLQFAELFFDAEDVEDLSDENLLEMFPAPKRKHATIIRVEGEPHVELLFISKSTLDLLD